MVSEPRKSSRTLQLISHVLVIYGAHTTTKYFHIPFLQEIFSFKSYGAVGLLGLFNDKIETPVFKKRCSKQILICEVEAHFFLPS